MKHKRDRAYGRVRAKKTGWQQFALMTHDDRVWYQPYVLK